MSSSSYSSAKRKSLEKELSKYLENREYNFARLLNSLKRLFDRWAMAQLTAEVNPAMKIGYMPFLMHIGINGITTTELAQSLLVSKQAMSKMLKELLEQQFIELRPNPKDARSQLIYLSDFGLGTVVKSRRIIGDLMEIYENKIGGEDFRKCMDALLIIENMHLSEK